MHYGATILEMAHIGHMRARQSPSTATIGVLLSTKPKEFPAWTHTVAR
jgi:hypothetical protein